MSNTFKVPVKVKGGGLSLPNSLDKTNSYVQQIIWSKPILNFDFNTMREPDENEVKDGITGMVPVTLEFSFQIDPKKLHPRHSSRIQALQDRIGAATRMVERFASAQRQDGGNLRVTRADLPDEELLTDLYMEMDDAANDRLCDLVMRDESGQTMWNWVDESGNDAVLTPGYIKDNVKLGESMQAAFLAWLNPTKALSDSASSAKKTKEASSEKKAKESGTQAATNLSTEPTNQTPNPSSSVLPTNSGPVTTTSDPITDAASSLSGMNLSS